ncbi:ATP-dependent dethiobiotin synthetase BioD, partial [Haemophilus influenzae]
MGKVIFISGIDTDVGKTIATGIYAKKLMEQGCSVITQKMIQTGCKNIADDLLVHRKIQGIDLTEEDLQGETCPYVFEYPCSPHLAAKRESRK